MPHLEVKRASDRNYLSLNTGTAPSDMLQSASISAAVYLRRTASQAGTPLLADRADDAALRPRVIRGQLVLVREHFIVLNHVHHLVAARLELADQFRDRLGGVVLEIVYQDDALAVLLKLFHHRFDHVFRLVQLEIARELVFVIQML